ncbi:MAG: response regulator [Candidatus Marinimicrobia bacterium]|nr:response regulator [Candidatus Neomarinimicrobiota bacterium]
MGLGYDLLTAYDGKQGLESAIENQPDLIILDIRMPVMDGLTMLTKLREREDGKAIPIVIVTAKDLNDQERDDLSGQVVRIIEKSAHTAEIMGSTDRYPCDVESA